MQNLCLYTASFPFGFGEQFLETEIKYLAQRFKKVIIIPQHSDGEKRKIPTNAHILSINTDSGYSTIKGLLSLKPWAPTILFECLKLKGFPKIISKVFRLSYQSKSLLSVLKKENLTDPNTLHYTYWLDDQTTLLAILKTQKLIHRYISRAHGYDLYTAPSIEHPYALKKLQIDQAYRIFLISQHGLEYIKNAFPKYSTKYRLAYLGTERKNLALPKIMTGKKFLIISCSRLVEVKRVNLIIDALAAIQTEQIHWVHIGAGPMQKEITAFAQKRLSHLTNITYCFKGHLSNSEVFNFYNANSPDLFLNVSSSEGLPVSLMEAISFGIPIIATDVGGSSEIANSHTGFLLNANPTIEEIKNTVLNCLLLCSRNPGFRENIQVFWSNHFNAESNYQSFVKSL